MNEEQKWNKTTAATKTVIYLHVTDITQQSGIFFGDHVKFNTGFQIIYLFIAFNIKPRLPFWVRNNALNEFPLLYFYIAIKSMFLLQFL